MAMAACIEHTFYSLYSQQMEFVVAIVVVVVVVVASYVVLEFVAVAYV